MVSTLVLMYLTVLIALGACGGEQTSTSAATTVPAGPTATTVPSALAKVGEGLQHLAVDVLLAPHDGDIVILAEGLDRLVDEQAHHLGSCPKNRLFRTFGDISAKV